MDQAALGELRRCLVPGCVYTVINGLTDPDHILRAVSNHIAAIHPPTGSGAGGGGAAKSTATIPLLEENITETQWDAWKYRFERYCVTCKLKDEDVVNQVFETIPSSLADQIAVNLTGTETKVQNLAKIKDTVVKKRSIFLYCKDFNGLSQSRGEDPERFAARIRQAAPACKFTADGGTAAYGADIMSTIFILGLDDTYTQEQLYQI